MARKRAQNGIHATEGSRKLRAYFAGSGAMTYGDFIKRLAGHRIITGDSSITRYAFGDTRVPLKTAMAIEAILGIPAASFLLASEIRDMKTVIGTASISKAA